MERLGNSPMLKEEWYFRHPYTCREDIEADYEIFDSSMLNKFAGCPYDYSLRYEHKLHAGVPRRAMFAGSAIHLGLDYFYTTGDEAGSIKLMREYWDDKELEKLVPIKKEAHLTGDHLERAMQYYYDQWLRERVDIYTPIDPPTLDSLNLDDVIAAKWRITDDGRVVLGESNLLMEFKIGDLTLVLAGKPDHIVQEQGGSLYIMDHKTTGSWISNWYWRLFDADNKMKVYIAMIYKLLGVMPRGYVINAICVHERATTEKFGGTRSDRKAWSCVPEQVEDGLKNMMGYRAMIEKCRDIQWFPQGCDRCWNPDLCNNPHATRDYHIATTFEETNRGFFDI